MRAWAALVLLGLGSDPAQAASRARYGGTLKVALAGRTSEVDPLLADAPADAALLSLVARPVCRLDARRGVVPTLAQELSRPAPDRVRLELRPGLKSAQGRPLTTAEAVGSWSRLFGPTTASPYRALLYPLKEGGQRLAASVQSPTALELQLAFPFPDFERALCHPALGLTDAHAPEPSGLGPFRSAGKGAFAAQPYFPEGRPFIDAVQVASTDERGAMRLFSQKKAQLIVGGAPDAAVSSPALYATYLVFQRSRTSETFKAEIESAIERADLTRFFVRAPATPMRHLLPPALWAGADATVARPAMPPRSPSPRELTIVYDAALDDQAAVAARLQVKLFDRGWRVTVKGVPRSQLRARWWTRDFDVMLQGVLLPPSPSAALGVVLDVAGRHDLLGAALPQLGAIADSTLRDARARELSDALAQELDLVPLYAQGLRVTAAPGVLGLAQDAQGLPLFEGVFFESPDAAGAN